MRTLPLALAACAAGLLSAGLAATAVAQSASRAARNESQPQPLNTKTPVPFQGRLTDSSGAAVGGQVSLTFALYKQQNGTTVLWSEQHSVTPQDGWFAVVLGDVGAGGNALPDWDGSELWLGVTVQGDAEMTPRTPILPVPAAAIANPTQHAQTHAHGGTDELGAQTSFANELVRANGSGQIDPSWLPAAGAGSAGAITLSQSGQLGLSLLPTSTTEAPNAIPVVNASTGRLDPSWLPLASAGTEGAVALDANGHLALGLIPTSITSSMGAVPIGSTYGKLDPSWLPGATPSSIGGIALDSNNHVPLSLLSVAITATINAMPVASPGTGKLDPSWLPVASVGNSTGALTLDANGHVAIGQLPTSIIATASAVPIAAGTGKLDPSWLPVASAANSTGALTLDGNGHVAIGQLPTSSTATASAVPIAAGTGKLDPSWLPLASVANGGTGTSAPKITRNICFYNAGPSGSQQPTQLLPPDLGSCTATRAYASAVTGPSSNLTVGFYRYGSTSGLVTNMSWSAGAQSAQSGALNVALNAGDIFYMQFSAASVTNSTTCLQVSCSYSFQ